MSGDSASRSDMAGLDAIDGAHLDQAVASRGYQMIRERCRQMAERKLRELAQPLDSLETERARGFIAGVEACLRVPQILEKEIAKAGGE